MGKPNWHKMASALKKLDDYVAKGNDASFDIYPYTAGSTMFSVVFPPWSLEGGMVNTLERLAKQEVRDSIIRSWKHPEQPSMDKPGWDNHVYLNGWNNIVISSVRSNRKEIVGKSVMEIATSFGVSPEETAFSLMSEEQGDIGAIMFSMDEECVAAGIRHPLGMICTDGLLGGKPHPRVYGSFPRVLGHFVRDRGDLKLEDAVHKMTGKPAARLGLKDRGILKPGLHADIVVFDPKTIIDTATYVVPRSYPKGIEHVVVNGVHSIKKGAFSGSLGGKFLRRTRASR
jgi:N-acyl-D-amino-acid deacylase